MTEPKNKRRTLKPTRLVEDVVSVPVVASPVPAGQRLGYVRVSTVDQNPARQLEAIGPVHRVFTDKVSGKSLERPELQALLRHARSADVVVVASLDRLGRNLSDVLRLVDEFLGNGVAVEFKKEGWTFEPGKNSSQTRLFLQIIGAIAEFERALILERQREGIALAKRAGRYKGRPKALKPVQVKEILRRRAAGDSVAVLAAEFGVSRQTIYSLLKQ